MAGRRAGRSGASGGQAITETLLMTWGLVMILCIILQAFLIDQHAFQLATRAHALLFTQVAYPGNRPSVPYETRWTQKLEGPDEYVPVVGFFRLHGVTRDELRIRSIHGRPGGYKRIKLGRGTKPDVAAGLAGLADVSSLLSQIGSGMSLLDEGRRRAQEARNRPPAGRR
jgi:hypothetical protein